MQCLRVRRSVAESGYGNVETMLNISAACRSLGKVFRKLFGNPTLQLGSLAVRDKVNPACREQCVAGCKISQLRENIPCLHPETFNKQMHAPGDPEGSRRAWPYSA